VDASGWSTQRGTEYVLSRAYNGPTCARQVSDVVAQAERSLRRVRMTGSGLSFSDVAICDDWLLSPRGLARIFDDVDRSRLRSGLASASRLVRIQSGVRIRELNQTLDRRGLALANMGGWDEQTFVGAAMTGTHGSGLDYGPLASQIASIQLVGPGGRLLQVEPSNGITDRATFAGHLEDDSSLRIDLVQDDDLFDAVVVSMGSMGIVYAVVLEAVPKFWLIERRTLTTWEDLAASTGDLPRLVRGEAVSSDLGRPDHFEVFYTPYSDATGKHMALLTQRWRRAPEPPIRGTNRQGSIWYSLLTALGLGADMAHLLEPYVARFDRAQILSFHQTALSQLAEDHYVNVGYEVFNTGRPNQLMVYGIEMAFDVSQAVEAVNRSFALATSLANDGIYQTSPISLRFVAASGAHLAMQHGRTTMTMEVPMAVGIPGAEEVLRRYELELMSSMGARPHWGLDRNVLHGTDQVARLYPQWPRWRDAFRRLNPLGVFDGRFTDRLGISGRSV